MCLDSCHGFGFHGCVLYVIVVGSIIYIGDLFMCLGSYYGFGSHGCLLYFIGIGSIIDIGGFIMCLDYHLTLRVLLGAPSIG